MDKCFRKLPSAAPLTIVSGAPGRVVAVGTRARLSGCAETPAVWVCTVDGGVFAALLGAVRLLSIWCLSVGVEQGAFGRAVGEVRKSVVSELT